MRLWQLGSRSSATSPSATQKVNARAASRCLIEHDSSRSIRRISPPSAHFASSSGDAHECARHASAGYAPISNSSRLSSISSWRDSFARAPGHARFIADPWVPLVEQFLFAAFSHPWIRGLRLSLRPSGNTQSQRRACRFVRLDPGSRRGLAVGWGAVVVCVLAMVIAGWHRHRHQYASRPRGRGCLPMQPTSRCSLWAKKSLSGLWISAFCCRGRPVGAAFGFAAVLCDRPRLACPGPTNASIAISVVFSFLLTTAYLRTRALWLSWGLNFGWKASQALIFGLAVSGVSSHSPIIEGNPMGPFWLTGGGFGLDGSWFACLAFSPHSRWSIA